jgi:hypothetical protein
VKACADGKLVSKLFLVQHVVENVPLGFVLSLGNKRDKKTAKLLLSG